MSQDSVHRPQFWKRKESRSRFEPRSLCLPAYRLTVRPNRLTGSVYTIQPFEATCIVCVRLAVTCHLHFWQNDWDPLRAIAATRGWNEYQNKSHKVDPGEEKSSADPAGTRTHDLSITSPAF